MKNTNQLELLTKAWKRIEESSEETLREAKKKNRPLRNMRRIYEAKQSTDRFDIDQGVCWMCWMDLTGKPLKGWRTDPYSRMEGHSRYCPICGYSHWKGRVWFPFRFLRGYIGNPSSRHGMTEK